MSSVPPTPDDQPRRDRHDHDEATCDRLHFLTLQVEARGDMRLSDAFRDACCARLGNSFGETHVDAAVGRRLADALARGAAVIVDAARVRPSGPSAGPPRYVRGDASVLLAAGLPAANVRVIESAGDPNGPQAVLLDRLAGGKLGVLVAPTLAHLWRDPVRRTDMLKRLGDAGTLLLVHGGIYDLCDPAVQFALMMDDVCRAVHQSARRRVRHHFWACRARALAAPCALGTGLVWAAPEDSAYRARVDAAGLSSWLDAVPDGHRARWGIDGTAYYVLPFPDAAVVHAVQLGLAWLLDTQSVSAVLELICGGADGWPVPGAVPRHAGGRWVDAANNGARWEPATIGRLRTLLGHPSVFGTFDLYRRPGTADWSAAGYGRVVARRAFPSFATPESEPFVRAALRARAGKARRPTGDGSHRHSDG